MKYTDPQHFGFYEIEKWPLWPFWASLALGIILIYFDTILAFVPIAVVIFLVNKKGYFMGISDATDMPVAPAIGQANIRATFTRRVVTDRPVLPFLKGDSRTQLVVFIALSELAKTRLREAGKYDAILYTFKFDHPDSLEYPYRVKDIIEKGPIVFQKSDVTVINRFEHELRQAIDTLAQYVKNLSEDQARSSSDTVEY